MSAALKYTEADLNRATLWLHNRPNVPVRELAELLAAEREFAARQCDEVARSPSRTPSEKALARQLAKRIREGRP